MALPLDGNDDLPAARSESDHVLFNSLREWRNRVATDGGVLHDPMLKNR